MMFLFPIQCFFSVWYDESNWNDDDEDVDEDKKKMNNSIKILSINVKAISSCVCVWLNRSNILRLIKGEKMFMYRYSIDGDDGNKDDDYLLGQMKKKKEKLKRRHKKIIIIIWETVWLFECKIDRKIKYLFEQNIVLEKVRKSQSLTLHDNYVRNVCIKRN